MTYILATFWISLLMNSPIEGKVMGSSIDFPTCETDFGVSFKFDPDIQTDLLFLIANPSMAYRSHPQLTIHHKRGAELIKQINSSQYGRSLKQKVGTKIGSVSFMYGPWMDDYFLKFPEIPKSTVAQTYSKKSLQKMLSTLKPAYEDLCANTLSQFGDIEAFHKFYENVQPANSTQIDSMTHIWIARLYMSDTELEDYKNEVNQRVESTKRQIISLSDYLK